MYQTRSPSHSSSSSYWGEQSPDLHQIVQAHPPSQYMPAAEDPHAPPPSSSSRASRGKTPMVEPTLVRTMPAVKPPKTPKTPKVAGGSSRSMDHDGGPNPSLAMSPKEPKPVLTGAALDGSSIEGIGKTSKASLELQGDLNTMAIGWNHEEWTNRRRLVQFWRRQDGSAIHAAFRPIAQADYIDNSIVISCIYRDETNECYVTSVDTIYLLEALIGIRFSVEEKNRIRRNLEGLKPATIAKHKATTADFFRLIMSLPKPKPRNIEKDVKVFRWANFGEALVKIISKYSVAYRPEGSGSSISRGIPGPLQAAPVVPSPLMAGPSFTLPRSASPLPSSSASSMLSYAMSDTDSIYSAAGGQQLVYPGQPGMGAGGPGSAAMQLDYTTSSSSTGSLPTPSSLSGGGGFAQQQQHESNSSLSTLASSLQHSPMLLASPGPSTAHKRLSGGGLTPVPSFQPSPYELYQHQLLQQPQAHSPAQPSSRRRRHGATPSISSSIHTSSSYDFDYYPGSASALPVPASPYLHLQSHQQHQQLSSPQQRPALQQHVQAYPTPNGSDPSTSGSGGPGSHPIPLAGGPAGSTSTLDLGPASGGGGEGGYAPMDTDDGGGGGDVFGGGGGGSDVFGGGGGGSGSTTQAHGQDASHAQDAAQDDDDDDEHEEDDGGAYVP